MRLFDAHCHLDFMSNMDEVARDAAADGLHVLATTVTPQGYLRARDALAGLPNVSVAVGAHPWWVADGRLSPADVRAAADLAGTARYVGEVGMDFSPRRRGRARRTRPRGRDTAAGAARYASWPMNAAISSRRASACWRPFT